MVSLALSVLTASADESASDDTSVLLSFVPPTEMVGEPDICLIDLSETVGEDWLPHWVGAEFQYARRDEVRSDFKRLQADNAERWREEIERAIDWLVANDSRYTQLQASQDLISLYLKLDLPQEIARRNLVVHLLREELEMTPAQLIQVADLMITGTAVPENRQAGLALLAKAAFLGNSQAILRLIYLGEQGENIPYWTVQNDIALTIAQNGIIGTGDPALCSRAPSVARMFQHGLNAPTSPELAEQWYMFAAMHGDGEAAWRIAQMHISGMEIERNVDTMMQYLEQAAEAGLFEAKMQLARFLDIGAIVDQDLDAALEIYRTEAEADRDVARVELASFLDRHRDLYPELQPLRIENLRILSDIDDARGWVFTHLGRHELETHGRWQGQAAARELFEIAVERKDYNALLDLADLVLSNHRDPVELNYALDLMELSLLAAGNPNTVIEIAATHVCRAPDAPNPDAALYWIEVANDLGVITTPLSLEILEDRFWTQDPLRSARLQTLALNEIPQPMVHFYLLLKAAGNEVTGDTAYFDQRIREVPRGLRFLGEETFDGASTEAQIRQGLDFLREAIDQGEPYAAVSLARRILRSEDQEHAHQEAVELLIAAAEQGEGRALYELAMLQNTPDVPSADELWQQYQDAINRDGDFYAYLFAMTQTRGQQHDYYYDRAVTLMDCNFDEALFLAEHFGRRNQLEEASRWLDAASLLVNGRAERMIKIGDRILETHGERERDAVIGYFEEAFELGSTEAMMRLSLLYGTADSESFSPQKAAEMLISMLTSGEERQEREGIRYIDDVHMSVYNIVRAEVNLPFLYGVLAQRGDRVAMRMHAQILREAAVTPAEVTQANAWYRRAAEAGDSQAMLVYSQILAYGLGIQPNPTEARAWLERSARNGNNYANRVLFPGRRP